MAIVRGQVKGFEDADPEHSALYEDVATVRTRGVGNPSGPLLDLEALLSIARMVSTAGTDNDKIVETLQHAAQRLGGGGTKSVEALLGLDPEVRGHDVGERRARAALQYDFIAVETFRTRYEPQLLMAVATHLFILLAEHRLSEASAKQPRTIVESQPPKPQSEPRPKYDSLPRRRRHPLVVPPLSGLAPMIPREGKIYYVSLRERGYGIKPPFCTAYVYVKVDRAVLAMNPVECRFDERTSLHRVKRWLGIPYRAYVLVPSGERYREPLFITRWFRLFMLRFVYKS